jgi:hypothetical protein
MPKFSRIQACLLLMFLGSCEESPSSDCNLGELDCACNAGQCLAGLACEANVCVQQIGDEASSSETETTNEDSTSDESADTETGPMCDPPQMLCGDECVDVMSDDSNCGACGNECAAVLDAGGCVDGECSPTWSSCVPATDPLTSCTDLCQAEGFEACALCGPSSLSVIWFGVPMDCEIGSLWDAEAGSCQIQPDADLSSYYRCCCAQ